MTMLLSATALVAGGALATATYLFALRRAALRAFLRLEAELDRRYNLGLKLIRTTQDHFGFDAEPLARLVDARGAATQTALAAFLQPEEPALVQRLIRADADYGRALSGYVERLRHIPMALTPETHALLRTLAATTERVRPAEIAYNDAAAAYNSVRGLVPALGERGALPAHLPLFQFAPTPLRILFPLPSTSAA